MATKSLLAPTSTVGPFRQLAVPSLTAQDTNIARPLDERKLLLCLFVLCFRYYWLCWTSGGRSDSHAQHERTILKFRKTGKLTRTGINISKRAYDDSSQGSSFNGEG